VGYLHSEGWNAPMRVAAIKMTFQIIAHTTKRGSDQEAEQHERVPAADDAYALFKFHT